MLNYFLGLVIYLSSGQIFTNSSYFDSTPFQAQLATKTLLLFEFSGFCMLQDFDHEIIGQWILKSILNSSGTEMKIDPAMQGLRIQFYKSGEFEVRSPYTDRLIESTGNKISLPKSSWLTQDGLLIKSSEKVTDKTDPNTTIQPYQISNDSLILSQGNGMKYIYIRVGKKQSK